MHKKMCHFILKIFAKTLCIIWTHWWGELIFLLYRYYLPEAGMTFAHHLYSSGCKQTQAIQSALSPGGERVLTGLGVLSTGQYPALNAQTLWRGLASSRWLWQHSMIAMIAERRPKSHFLSLLGSYSSWTPTREWTFISSSHCTTKKLLPRYPVPLWPSCTARAMCSPCPGSRTGSPWAIPEQGAHTSARLGPKQHKMSWTMPCKTLQKQKQRLQSQLALGTTQKVCRKYLQGSLYSYHKTNFKNNEPLVQEFLLKPARYHPESSCLGKFFFS